MCWAENLESAHLEKQLVLTHVTKSITELNSDKPKVVSYHF